MAERALAELAPSGLLVVIAAAQGFTWSGGACEFNVVMAAVSGILFGQNLQRFLSARRASSDQVQGQVDTPDSVGNASV